MNGGHRDEAVCTYVYVVYVEWRTQNERESKLWNMEKLKVKVHSQVFVLNLMIYFLVSGNNLKNVIDWLG